jgi:hypothetical protein
MRCRFRPMLPRTRAARHAAAAALFLAAAPAGVFAAEPVSLREVAEFARIQAQGGFLHIQLH